jgi:hypothetical protein
MASFFFDPGRPGRKTLYSRFGHSAALRLSLFGAGRTRP